MREVIHYVSDINRVGVTACQIYYRIGNIHATTDFKAVTCKRCLKRITLLGRNGK